MTFDLVINGNQDDPEGNPIGYKRTLNHSWRADSTKYHEWKEYVRAAFQRKYPTANNLKPHPIQVQKGDTIATKIDVWWKDGKHADLDNVVKGILDSLIDNDKVVCEIHAQSQMSDDKKGKVHITITMHKP